MPTFSVMVPCYNHERYIGAALDSLLAQTDPDWEAIVVNDGSTDGSAGIIDDYAKRDPRIRAFHKANGGVSSALNLALREARGDWICWLSSDDLFEPCKLVVHREWFGRDPACRFFFTHYSCLIDPGGRKEHPDLWQPLPMKAFQIVRLMRGNYIPGIGICVDRVVWRSVGSFDEALRVSQDYDMWLRLLAAAPATFIPERTCVTRVHESQGSKTQRGRCFRESSAACIHFLNGHKLEDVFPLIDWRNPGEAREAVAEAVDVASRPHSFLYGLGAHLALVNRVMEWLWDESRDAWVADLRDYFVTRARTAAGSQAGTDLGFLWRAVWVAAREGRTCPYSKVDPELLAQRTADDAEVQSTEVAPSDASTIRSGRTRREVTFVCATGARLDVQPYGAMRMLLTIAEGMKRRGDCCLLAGLSDSPVGTLRGLLFLGAPDDVSLLRMLKGLSPISHLIANSRDDVFLHVATKKATIYHHNLAPVYRRISPQAANAAGISVVCVSEYSRRQILDLGIRSDRIAVVPNTYDAGVYRYNGEKMRECTRIVYAGAVCRGKGADIALRAFERVSGQIPAARMDIYGKQVDDWRDGPCDLRNGWRKPDGSLDWEVIGAALPGVAYHGEVEPAVLAKAFGAGSVVVIPSRSENFPLVALEAQACGCLPVAFEVGGVAETFVGSRTGYLCAENTVDGLAETLVRVLCKEPIAPDQREFSAERVRTLYSKEKTVDVFCKAIDKVDHIGLHGRSILLRQRTSARVWNKLERIRKSIQIQRDVGAPSA